MEMKIPLVSNIFSAQEIHDGLQLELSNIDGAEVILKDESEDDLALEPVIATAIITGSVQVLAAIITGLFLLWGKKHETEATKKTVSVRIRIDKDGNEIEFPYGMSGEEQEALINSIVNLSTVRHISLIEK